MIRTRIDLLRAEKTHSEGRNITYQVMEAETGIAYTTLQRLAKGKTKGIDFDTLSALCQYFNCTAREILDYVPDE